MAKDTPFASSRYLLWDKPPAYPFFDIITKDSHCGKVFDLNIELDSYDGSVYIKVQDIVEMARTIGMATQEEVAKIKEENKELRRQINKLPVVQEELKDGLDSLVAKFFARLNSVDNLSDNTEHTEPQDDREPEEAESTPIGPFSI